MIYKDSVDEDGSPDIIYIQENQQKFTFTYVIGEDKDNGTSTNTQ